MNPFLDVINQLLPEPQAALLNGILFGTHTSFPTALYQALIVTGTVHITALSGQNIAILTRIISEITLPLGRRVSIVVSGVGIVIFVLFVGLEPTTVRAAIMGSISLLAIYFGRKNWSLLSLILAAGIMLILNPDWGSTISFQLSFMATLGIILWGGQVSAKTSNSFKREVFREAKINLRTTLAAQILTTPLIFYYFDRISLISPLTNVLIGSLIAPIMILGFLTAIGGWLFIPVGQIFAWCAWVLLSILIYIVELTAQIPFASIELK